MSLVIYVKCKVLQNMSDKKNCSDCLHTNTKQKKLLQSFPMIFISKNKNQALSKIANSILPVDETDAIISFHSAY